MANDRGETVLFNPEQTPTVYDEQGRSVAGASRVTVSELDAVAQRAVAAGVLVREEPKASARGSRKAGTDAPPLPDKAEDSGASTPAKRG